MSKPVKVQLQIYQGATFTKRFGWGSYPYAVTERNGVIVNVATGRLAPSSDYIAINLTGWTARMQARRKIDDPDALFTLTTENGGIVLGGIGGTVDIVMDAVETSGFDWKNGVWDLELVAPGGSVTRLAEGSISVSPEVTRD